MHDEVAMGTDGWVWMMRIEAQATALLGAAVGTLESVSNLFSIDTCAKSRKKLQS